MVNGTGQIIIWTHWTIWYITWIECHLDCPLQSFNIGRERVMVFHATFNNISAISWLSVLLGGGNRSTCRKPEYLYKTTMELSHVTDKLYQMMLYQVHLAWAGLKLTTLVLSRSDCIGSYKSNYHMITTMTPYYGCQMVKWAFLFYIRKTNNVLLMEKTWRLRENHLTNFII